MGLQIIGPMPSATCWDREFADSPLEGGVRCELVSNVSFIRRSDEFLESIKKGDRNVEPVSEAQIPC